MTDMAGNDNESNTQVRYTTRDAEKDRDDYMEKLIAELPQSMRLHVGLKKRCSVCRHYEADHPTKSEKYCRRERLEGQNWISSICGERDTYKDLLQLDEKTMLDHKMVTAIMNGHF